MTLIFENDSVQNPLELVASKDNQRLILYLDYIKAEAAENLSTTARGEPV